MSREAGWTMKAAALVLLVCAAALPAEAAAPGPNRVATRKLDGALRAQIVDSVLSRIVDEYILPDVALRMDEHVRQQLASGAYDSITSLGVFTTRLTSDLHEINPDRHLLISVMQPQDFYPSAGDTLTAADRAERSRQNYGFRKVERLMGNVGYLELNMFDDAAYAGEAAAAAMGFLARCDAIIIDLRANGGGEESMVQLLMSYFLAEPTLLRDVSHRNQKPWQSWSLPYVPGRSLRHADLYVLVGYNTGSAAEAFSSSMKHLAGATLVGETTRGAAYMCDFYDFPELGVRAKISTGMPIEPTTGTNWERVGVEPQVKVPVDEALDRAYQLALEKLAAADPPEPVQYEIDWVMAGIAARQQPLTLSDEELARYAGTFGDVALVLDNGTLYYQMGQIPRSALAPMTAGLFAFADAPYKRLRFAVDERGRVSGLEILYDDGYLIQRDRSSD